MTRSEAPSVLAEASATAGLDAHARLLAKALEKLLGRPGRGAMAFVRCLPRDVVLALSRSPVFALEGWDVYGVTDGRDEASRLITADWAVELREDKCDPALLLVDVGTAGAGMDGIYSASREITERQLFKEANRLALKEIMHGSKGFAESAVKRARKVGERNTVSPWREFDFYVRSAATGNPGSALTLLGMWPIRVDERPQEADLETSARIVEKLLLGAGPPRTAAARADSLMLVDPPAGAREALEDFLRRAAGLPLDAALEQLNSRPELWLHAIEPGFVSPTLQRIEIVTWRGKAGKVAAWSGLEHRDDELPLLIIDPDFEGKGASKLEVRWKTHPEAIKRGEVEYRVSVVAADEELAARTIPHADKTPQTARFTAEDFADLDEDARFEAHVRVSAIGAEGVESADTEEFLLQFGQRPDKPTAGAGTKVRSLVEGAIHLPDRETFLQVCDRKNAAAVSGEDKRGWVVFRPRVEDKTFRSFRVYRPSLVRAVEADWLSRPEEVGRWSVRVRTDGSRIGDPEFHALNQGDCPAEVWAKLVRTSRRFCEEVAAGAGLVARIACGGKDPGDDYVNSWAAALEQGAPQLALAHTVEVKTLSGRTLGLIVLPSHPLRVAWHTAYDHLAQHARYQLNMSAAEVSKTLAALDSSHFPALLPGLTPGASFVFGDALGFHAVAMVPDSDREPKAAVAQIAQCFADGEPDAAPTVGRHTASVLAAEIDRYYISHPVHRSLHVHALRPGDGSTMARALGLFLSAGAPDGEESGEEPGADAVLKNLSFVLELFPAERETNVTGRFLARTVEGRRSGAAGMASQDRWMLESLPCPGGITLPRLRWARRESPLPDQAAHLAVAFDIFESRIACAPPEEVDSPRPLHAFGLVAAAERRCRFTPLPQWDSFQPPQPDGERHPAGRPLTDRLLRVQRALLRGVCRNRGGGGGANQESSGPVDAWPVLRTTLSAESEESLARLHRLSDWVITVDRNAGIEYFDSPREAGSVYDAYVIDAVPERDDLGCMQMVTSTSQTAEVRDLLDEALGEMGLSSSLRNCQFLLQHLKAMSGRLAIRLTSPAVRAGELIALAMVHANCLAAEGATPQDAWLPLATGFLMPLDDVRDLYPGEEGSAESRSAAVEGGTDRRADLLFVTAPSRGGLQLSFVEVKYRRHLRSAREPALLADVVGQAEGTWASWMQWYFSEERDVPRALRRSRLARAMRFYADKARRHHLGEDAHSRVTREIDRMLTAGADYKLTTPTRPNRGYVFCPEVTSIEPVELPTDPDGETRVFLFGPGRLPDLAAEAPQAPQPALTTPPVLQGGGDETKRSGGEPQGPPAATPDANIASPDTGPSTIPAAPSPDVGTGSARVTTPATLSEVASVGLSEGTSVLQEPDGHPEILGASVVLGHAVPGGTPVAWDLSIRSNPHLMIVGLPGMGKTTCLISLCRQLVAGGVTPIVFSYHQDLDEKLATDVRDLRLLDHTALGFNPLAIDNPGPNAHVDSAGMLRDIFAAIFPDFGDIQTERVRQAIKKSYTDIGWGAAATGGTPKFRTFFDLLREEPKPDKGLMARLTELDDYGVFAGEGEGGRLLDSARPTILQIHRNQNEVVQRAFASLIFYSIYKDMFRRGVQQKLTHAIVFDEAHRASRLKLLPTMAKECRKYGLSLILASQEARDFDISLYSAIANYLALRLTEHDSRALAKNIAPSDIQRQTADRLKLMDKYHALFFGEGRRRPVSIALNQ